MHGLQNGGQSFGSPQMLDVRQHLTFVIDGGVLATAFHGIHDQLGDVHTASFRVIPHEDFIRRHAGQRLVTARKNHIGELADIAEVCVGRSAPGQLPPEVLAKDIRRRDHGLALLAAGPQHGHQNHDRVLHALRHFGHAALPVGQFQLMLAQSAAQVGPMAAELVEGEMDMSG